MDTSWPLPIETFEQFLREKGFRYKGGQQGNGEKSLFYEDDSVIVEIASSGGATVILFHNKRYEINRYFDAAILSQWLLSTAEDHLSVAEQVDFVKTYWAELMAAFAPDAVRETYAALEVLMRARGDRAIERLTGQKL